MLSPVTRVNRPKSKKGAVRAAASAERRPWSRHPGEGETTDPGPDPARWGGSPPDAGQCPAGDDPPHHREDHRQGHCCATIKTMLVATIKPQGRTRGLSRARTFNSMRHGIAYGSRGLW